MPHIKTVSRVRAKKTLTFFILLYYAKTFTVDVIFDMGDKLININQLAEEFSQEHISALLALHAFTGADCTSAFKGKGHGATHQASESAFKVHADLFCSGELLGA